jgi:hypothetical protein
MQITMKALLDDETRKEIREAVLGEARGVARSEVDLTINREVARLAALLSQELSLTDPSYRTRSLITEVVRNVLTSGWENLSKQIEAVVVSKMEDALRGPIEKAIEKAAERNIAEKLKAMTVWKAEGQDQYVRKVVRSELKKLLKD